MGYLRVLPRDAIETVRALFDDENGFWRPTGCALPRKWRSNTCLTYRCESAAINGGEDSADYKVLCDCVRDRTLPIVSVK